MLHVLSILSTPIPAVHLPISGPARPETYADLLEEFDVTATLSTVTSLVNLANYMLPQNKTLPLVHAVMFAGEALYPDQRVLLQQLFPNATFRSCILGSMDAGRSIVQDRVDDRLTANRCICRVGRRGRCACPSSVTVVRNCRAACVGRRARQRGHSRKWCGWRHCRDKPDLTIDACGTVSHWGSSGMGKL